MSIRTVTSIVPSPSPSPTPPPTTIVLPWPHFIKFNSPPPPSPPSSSSSSRKQQPQRHIPKFSPTPPLTALASAIFEFIDASFEPKNTGMIEPRKLVACMDAVGEYISKEEKSGDDSGGSGGGESKGNPDYYSGTGKEMGKNVDTESLTGRTLHAATPEPTSTSAIPIKLEPYDISTHASQELQAKYTSRGLSHRIITHQYLQPPTPIPTPSPFSRLRKLLSLLPKLSRNLKSLHHRKLSKSKSNDNPAISLPALTLAGFISAQHLAAVSDRRKHSKEVLELLRYIRYNQGKSLAAGKKGEELGGVGGIGWWETKVVREVLLSTYHLQNGGVGKGGTGNGKGVVLVTRTELPSETSWLLAEEER